jgi:mRNA interferase RelE/StbE
MYKARFLNIFLKQEKKHDTHIKKRIINIVAKLLKDPYSGIRMEGNLRGYWKERVGKYRILYKIEESEKIVIFFDVDLRKRVYSRIKNINS